METIRHSCLSLLIGLIIVAVVVVLPSGKASAHHDAAHNAKMKELDSASEALYRYMQDGNGAKAQLEMDTIVKVVQTLSFQGLTSVEGIHALSETIMDTREALARSQSQPEEWRMTSSRLRLAIDSLLHKEQTLWIQYYKLFTDDLRQLSEARTGADAVRVKQAFNQLKEHYETIRPAAVIQREPSLITRADSWMSYMENLCGGKTVDPQALGGALSGGTDVIHDLFGKKRTEPTMLPLTGTSNPWQWGLLIGGWIIVALTYTGIRNYNAYQEVRPAAGNKGRSGWRL
ncbi:sporulation protein YpjB [Paenibacillus sp. YPG26]|uniref:sporulation protein YpjB n=1 Tax=Paenibacillus sp. YPG26 TaxID=2878915 RepID=UPI00203BA506|nr:sporulation protein YpjB [Paenibacillus sp. YPG26]USB34792.1 sporulation protein YpjB [Paenibacillus sp. YPG26]